MIQGKYANSTQMQTKALHYESITVIQEGNYSSLIQKINCSLG
jgi:hypothetical protein